MSSLSDLINMQEDSSHEMCPHKPEFLFITVLITEGGGGGTVLTFSSFPFWSSSATACVEQKMGTTVSSRARWRSCAFLRVLFAEERAKDFQ